MLFRENMKTISLVFILFIACSCNRFMKPAPEGEHGLYSKLNNPVYQSTNSKDSLLLILKEKHLIIQEGRINKYDAPWDCFRYFISNINCDSQQIEAYIEFQDKKATNATFRVLWFKSVPTNDDSIYNKRTANYYQCFESLLKNCILIK